MDLLEFLIIKLFLYPPTSLNLKVARKWGKIIGTTAFFLSSKHRKIAIKNIENALNKNRKKSIKIALKSFSHLGKVIGEVLWAYRRETVGEFCRRIEVKGWEYIEKIDTPNFIVVSAHIGNWEMVGRAVSSFHSPIVVVGKPTKNKYITSLMENIRNKLGMEMIYKKEAAKKLIYCIKRRKNIGFVADQYVRDKDAVNVRFFRKEITVSKLPAYLSKKFYVPIVPIFAITHEPNKLEIIVKEPLADYNKSNEKITQQFTTTFEKMIKTYPEQWIWAHRRWR